jgi:TonB family protein
VLIGAGWLSLFLLNNDDQSQLGYKEEIPSPSTAAAKDSAAGAGGERTEVDATETPKSDQLLSLNEQKNEKKEETRQPAPATAGAKPAETEQSESIAEEIVASEDRQPVASDTSTVAPRTETVPQQALAAGESRVQEEGRARRAAKAAESAKSDFAADDVSRRITGKVTLADDGIALPGVNVRVKGTSTGTVTDLNGAYSIETSQDNPTLVFSFIGLQTKEEQSSAGSTVNVALADDVSQLSEVVVTGKKIPTDLSEEPVIKLAEPAGGYRAYDKYLDNNQRYPQLALDNNVKGRVAIQFTVGTDGNLHEFKIMKSVGFGCDEEVIRLIKEGPAWRPTTENDVPTESVVRVRMKFDAAKKKKK